MRDEAVTRREALAAGAVLLGGAVTAQPTPIHVPPPPGKKLGWAIVGLGKLTVEELLPAFARCEHWTSPRFVESGLRV